MTLPRYNTEAFSALAEKGFTSEYICIDHDINLINPLVTVEAALNMGFYPKGTKVQYLGEHGYDYDRECIEDLGVNKDDVLTVKTCSIGGWSSTYTFEEITGEHNTVLFTKLENDDETVS